MDMFVCVHVYMYVQHMCMAVCKQNPEDLRYFFLTCHPYFLLFEAGFSHRWGTH